MAKAVRLILVLLGLALVARPWWPVDGLPDELRTLPVRLAQAAGIAAIVLAWSIGLVARLLRRAGADHDDAAIRAVLRGGGFAFIELGRGWQAEGDWRGEALVVRRVSDTHATRFGRPWSLLATLPGTPREPWPFLPDQGGIVERGARSFTVVIADLALAGGAERLPARLDALLAARDRATSERPPTR